MLSVLMFHQVYNIDNPKQLAKFTSFIETLAKNYPIISPGDKLQKHRLSFCLTFDDAYFDFYQFVFPLLKRLNIPATLGVPVCFIEEETHCTVEERLSLKHGSEMDEQLYKTHTPFCTWQELKEMADSGLVKIASHGFNHCSLTDLSTDLDQELIQSKAHLEKKLQCSVDTFIYPYGKYSNTINKEVNRYYRYSMRIGSALNLNWENTKNVIYRINGDLLWQHGKTWNIFSNIKYYMKYLSNILRGK